MEKRREKRGGKSTPHGSWEKKHKLSVIISTERKGKKPSSF